MQTLTPPTLPQVVLSAPLTPTHAAMCVLKMTAAQILERIEDGQLRWAFDVSGGASARRDIRILSLCLADFQAGRPTRIPGHGNEFDLVMGLIFPMAKLVPGVVTKLKATTIARQFCMKTESLIKLADAGWLEFAPGTRRSTGPTGSPDILFSSVAAFLKSRRITA